MNNKIEKNFTLGGSLNKALSGDYELKVGPVLVEAWKCTAKNLFSFTPAILALLIVQLAIFYIVLQLQIGDPSLILDMFANPERLDETIFDAFFVANFSYEVISAPIVASVSLMAMGHTAGLPSKKSHILKGLQFTIPVILVTLLSLIIQGLSGVLFPLLSMYFAVTFSNALLLVCDKRLTPLRALMISFRAVNKKIVPISMLYLIMMGLMIFAALMFGFLLIIVLPFFFHVKGIIYRNMFGISLKIIATEDPSDSDDSDDSGGLSDRASSPDKLDKDNQGSDIFNA